MSGGQIGGIVGAGVGALLALPTGGMSVAWGAQIGYALGSAIGGYVDPMRVKGPQITDAASQTSSVGMPLPFGYGTFATSGNVIWADELKEHVKRQRQGKGGSTKTTTYTYTRSYAIGVCEGPIYGFLMIRRNGKTVYNSDPAAPVADKDYSAKWLQRATLYYGDDAQLPDSTIEAVEGAGNVSAFRGLAYIVIENEDLTDLAGAVPQYEFIVQATRPDVYVTSEPYPAHYVDVVSVSALPAASILSKKIRSYVYGDNVDIGASPVSGMMTSTIIHYEHGDSVDVSAEPYYGLMRNVYIRYGYGDAANIGAYALGGKMDKVVIRYENYSDQIYVSATPISGRLSENI